jgi:adenylate cyclase
LKEEMIDMVKSTLDKNRLPDDFTAKLLKYQGFVGKEIASMVEEDPGQIKLGGEVKDATIIFIDIVGFTPLTESLSIDQCIDLLNQYAREIGEVVFRHDGFIVDFLGDGILIAFGLPNYVEDHALKAVSAALEMPDAIKKAGDGKLKITMGIDSGEVIAGFFGHPKRFSYGILGHHVNLAAKMESIAEPNQILMTQYTYDRVRDSVNAEKLKEVQVRGEAKPLGIYGVKGMK